MTAKEYLNYFGRRGNMYYDFIWINFKCGRYYNNGLFNDMSEMFVDRSNNFLTPHYPHLAANIVEYILYHKILES